MKANFIYRFDPERHLHIINESVVPGLTSVCETEGLSDYSGIPEVIRQAAMDFGSDVHLATDLLDRGILDEESLTDRVAGCMAGYKRFHREHRVEWMWCEEPCGYGQGNLYGCVIDRAGKLDWKKAVVEIKTGQPQPWHGPQLAAQREAMRYHHGFTAGKAFGLYLNPSGTYRLIDYSQELDSHFSAFLSALNLHQWRKRYLRNET